MSLKGKIHRPKFSLHMSDEEKKIQQEKIDLMKDLKIIFDNYSKKLDVLNKNVEQIKKFLCDIEGDDVCEVSDNSGTQRSCKRIAGKV